MRRERTGRLAGSRRDSGGPRPETAAITLRALYSGPPAWTLTLLIAGQGDPLSGEDGPWCLEGA